MNQHRGPLLLILFAVMSVSGGYASPIHKSTIHDDFAFHSAYAIYSSASIDFWRGGTGSWSDPTEKFWSGGLPGVGSDVYIDSGGDDLVYLDTNATIASLTLGGTIGNSQLTGDGTAHYLIISGALTVNQTGTLSLNNGNTVAAASLAVNAGTIDLGSGATLQIYGDASNSGTIATGGGGNTVTIGGALTNSGSFALTCDSATAGSIFNSGGISLANGSTLLVSGDVLNSGSISPAGSDETGGNQITIQGKLTNSGSIGVYGIEGGFMLSVAGDANNSGTLEVGEYCDESPVCNTNMVNIDGTLTNTIDGFVKVGAPTRFAYGPQNSVSAGGLTNAGAIYLLNAASLTVNGNALNSGLIDLGFPDCMSCEGSATLAVGGTLTNTGTISLLLALELGASDTVDLGGLVNSGTFAVDTDSTIGVHGSVVNSGSISLEASGGAPVALYIGGALINSGALDLFGSGDPSYPVYANIGGFSTNTGTGTIFLRDRAIVIFNGDVNNSGLILEENNYSTSLNSLSIAGTLTNNPSGTLALNSSFADLGRLVNSGVVDLESGSSLQVYGDANNSGTIGTGNGANILTIGGALTNSGSLRLNGESDQATIGSVVNSGVIDLENGSTLQVNGGISNSGQITTSYYGYSGNTMMVGGRLTNGLTGTFSLGGASDIANIGSVVNQGAMYIASGATLNVTGGPHAGASALSGFTNTGIVNIAPNGRLAVVGNYTQTAGQTTVDGSLNISGRGMINFAGGAVYGDQGTIRGPIVSNASINIGDSLRTIGQLYFMGNYTQGPHGSLTFDIAGTAPGEYDQLNIAGHAQLNGLMTVDLLHGFLPELGDAFDIMHFSRESGTFSMIVGLPINGEEHFVLEYNSTDLTLDVVSGALLEPNFGSGASPATGPFILGADNDGTTLIASNLASGSASSNASSIASDYSPSSTTPEPGSLLLLGSGLLCVGYSVRRRMTK